MSKSKSVAVAPVVIKAPKITAAWSAVCVTSAKSEKEIVAAIENLSAVMILESRLTVADRKKFIKNLEESGKVSSFVKSSHVPALTTWSKLRSLHADFRALPVTRQLSTAMASYDILGAGKGESYKNLDTLLKEISTMRKAKNDKRKEASSVQTDSKKSKKSEGASNLDAIKAFTALIDSLDFTAFTPAEDEAIAMLQMAIENKVAVDA